MQVFAQIPILLKGRSVGLHVRGGRLDIPNPFGIPEGNIIKP